MNSSYCKLLCKLNCFDRMGWVQTTRSLSYCCFSSVVISTYVFFTKCMRCSHMDERKKESWCQLWSYGFYFLTDKTNSLTTDMKYWIYILLETFYIMYITSLFSKIKFHCTPLWEYWYLLKASCSVELLIMHIQMITFILGC